jgi:hypothetical protein
MDYRNLMLRLFWHEFEMLGHCDINEAIEEPSKASFTEEEKAEIKKLRDEAFGEWLWATHGDKASPSPT